MINLNNNFKNITKSLLALKAAVVDVSPKDQSLFLSYTLAHGIIFVDAKGAIITDIRQDIAETAIAMYGYNEYDFNETLIPDFLAENLDDDEFYITQIIHYAETALRSWIPFYVPSIYIDKKRESEAGPAFKITPIRVLTTEEEVVECVNDIFTSTVAPSANDTPYYEALAPLATIALSDIQSKELMCIVCAALGETPEDPEDILRYIVYKATGSTLLIKNAATINMLKAKSYSSTITDVLEAIGADDEKMAAMASIFCRYKPLFLALKNGTPSTNYIINRIRRLAVKYHKPQSRFVMKNVLALANEGNLKEVYKIVDRATNRELVKLYNACENYNNNLFQVRNGKVYVAEKRDRSITTNIILLKCYIENLLYKRLGKVYKDKTIVIPDYIDYAAPVSEKQMEGVFPWGTRIDADSSNVTVGIHWVNGEFGPTDLDLHAFTPTQHFGWNSAHRNDSKSILYSGDLTDAPAPTGATECYYLNSIEDPVMFNVSFFSKRPRDNMFQMYITSGNTATEKKTFDQLDLLTSPIPIASNAADNFNLGFFHDNAFYLYGGNVSQGMVPQSNYADFIEASVRSVKRRVSLKDLLEGADANVVSKIPEEGDYINLTPEVLDSHTLLDILDAEEK